MYEIPQPLELLARASGFRAPSAVEEVEDGTVSLPAKFDSVGELGRYNFRHEEPTITLYPLVIKQTAEKLNSPVEDVLYVVRLHNYAHVLHHLGFNEKLDFPEGASRGSRLAYALQTAQKIPWDAKGFEYEQMAQLLAYAGLLHYAKNAPSVPELKTAFRLRNCFVDLMHRLQHADYKILDLLEADAANILHAFTQAKVHESPFEGVREKLKASIR